jgi:hypothetical protein
MLEPSDSISGGLFRYELIYVKLLAGGGIYFAHVIYAKKSKQSKNQRK